jgi:anthranilate phosphoribosyltransferase
MTIQEAIKKVVDRSSLSVEEAESVLEQIMTGECTDAQIAALLTALRMKGETADELTGFARVMRRKATPVQLHSRSENVAKAGSALHLSSALHLTCATYQETLLDTCGTGGDMSGSFNISTATAFVVAGAGVRVAKHGNRSVSSRSGSADVMEALGIKIELPPERISQCIDEVGIGFLHAPLLHKAMKHVAPARHQMGIRTIFNLLGPLTNPAGADAQLIGVYAPHLTELLAEVLYKLGTKHALVVHGSDGMDEITITGSSKVTELRDGRLSTYCVRPENFGLSPAPLEEIRGGDAQRNAQIILSVLSGEPGPKRDIVLMNAAAALLASNKVSDFREGVQLARESIDSGRSLTKLRHLIEFTNS